MIFCIIFYSCAKETEKISIIKEKNQEQEMTTAYQEAYDMLNKNENFNAANKFLEAELLIPQSNWAPQSALMASYSFYLQNFYF